jgi:3-methylcrotonyl-CoA carboxylase alpha subunit
MRPIGTVLIANRGEIAIRIARACREMGIRSVAVYSDADADSLHVRSADSAVRIGPAAPALSYLSVDALIAAAKTAGADAVHPGYGFLSENDVFARAVESAGLIWIGPPADVIERMGSKISARRLMESAGVSVVPGITPQDQSDEGILSAVRTVGYPALVKASEGGGGKGMRTLRDERAALDMIGAARREALGAFGDGRLYVERFIERPRHVEIQVFGDAHGDVVHLFERECSLQRRHQKIVEESPSPALTPALRARMGEAAVAAARAAGYRNAGTIEFLVEGGGDSARFYFLEMNTRLQVEHPVTEAVTGTDLVRAQLAVAAGGPLPWTQASLTQRGHAIECRVYAEDPSNGFLPQAGPLCVYREPSGAGIRVDSGVEEGGIVSVHYDPLLAKLIAFAETREAAIERALLALGSYQISGIRTNIPFLMRLLQHPAVRSGAVHTQFVQEHLAALATAQPEEPEEPEEPAEPKEPREPREPTALSDPWAALEGWRVGAGEQRQRSISPRPATRKRTASHPGTLMAPMPATVVRIETEIGKQVARGDTLLILEAMKMELPVRATSAGIVRAINCAEGDLVQPGVVLIEMG